MELLKPPDSGSAEATDCLVRWRPGWRGYAIAQDATRYLAGERRAR